MIRLIVTHDYPVHIDETAAFELLMRHGREKFGIAEDVRFCTISESGFSAEELLNREDVLLLGLGGTEKKPGHKALVFDEHGLPEEEKQKTCTLLLVANALEMEDNFAWRRIYRYVHHVDRKGSGLTFDFHQFIILGQQYLKDWNLDKALERTRELIDAELSKQGQFAQARLEQIEWIQLPSLNSNPQDIAVAKIVDEERDGVLPTVAFFYGAPLVVVQRPSGHIQILTRRYPRIDLRDVVRLIRVYELKKKGVDPAGRQWWYRYESEPEIEEVPEWYFNIEMNNLLNGGRARQDKPATQLDLDTVLAILKMAFNEGFHPSRQQQCKQGVCTSKPEDECPMWAFGFMRCRRVRAPK